MEEINLLKIGDKVPDTELADIGSKYEEIEK